MALKVMILTVDESNEVLKKVKWRKSTVDGPQSTAVSNI